MCDEVRGCAVVDYNTAAVVFTEYVRALLKTAFVKSFVKSCIGRQLLVFCIYKETHGHVVKQYRKKRIEFLPRQVEYRKKSKEKNKKYLGGKN